MQRRRRRQCHGRFQTIAGLSSRCHRLVYEGCRTAVQWRTSCAAARCWLRIRCSCGRRWGRRCCLQTVESYVERFRPLCCVRGAVQDQVLGRDSRPSDGDRVLQGDSADAGGCGYLLDACAVSVVQVVRVQSKRERDIQLDGRVECGDRLYDPLGFVAVSRPPVVAHVHHLDPLGAPSPGFPWIRNKTWASRECASISVWSTPLPSIMTPLVLITMDCLPRHGVYCRLQRLCVVAAAATTRKQRYLHWRSRGNGIHPTSVANRGEIHYPVTLPG
ncbi:uncharacterized protein LOC112351002 isoform X3 [Selaginella moellendorffii]|uniref:uncharacterized protein LOC112351002 isoform X3 n=1 Tax=Selaginella moellendorffii TaxID=88036 RepID=UPI000D1CBCD5|nr:uncharacterized protein LOC112351002 isoform X3 [Selaginella moellendorffii]|eukprot:XP_024543873.1 uncharacterized protein LOC112351002 isoform X3 [Selaginella moellendorffii]